MVMFGNQDRFCRKRKLDQAAIKRNHKIIELYDRCQSVVAVAYKMQLPENVVKNILKRYFGIKNVM